MFETLANLPRIWNRSRPIAARPRAGFRPALEMLEDRLTPANTVNAVLSAGTLTITAADSAVLAENHNDITLTGNGAGNFKLTGNGTNVTGGTNFTGVTNIVLKMGQGDDRVWIDGATISGGLTVNGGDGNNEVTIGNAAGNCSFGKVTVTNGKGNDTFRMYHGTNTIAGALTLANGAGGSSAVIGVGTDQTVIGSVNITNGVGDDRLYVEGADFKVLGALTIKNGAGDSHTYLEPTSNLLVGGPLSITNAEGQDVLLLGDGGTATLNNVIVNNGHGQGDTRLRADQITIASLSITNGDGDDQLTVGANVVDVSITGNLTLQNGQGNSLTDLDPVNSLKIGGTVSITNGAGDDTAIFGKGCAVALHHVTISNGNGDSSTLFENSSLSTVAVTGNLSVTNGDGDDLFEALGLRFNVTGKVTLNNGNGATQTKFLSELHTKIDGPLSITNAVGNDDLAFYGALVHLGHVTLKNGNGASSTTFNSQLGTTIAGNLTVLNGTGVDFLGVYGFSWTATGNVAVNNGLGSAQTIFEAGSGTTFGSIIGGTLKFTGSTGNDYIRMFRTQVSAATTLNLGNGDGNVLSIYDSEFGAAFNLTCGDGNDELEIESGLDADNSFGTAFKGAVAIDLGAGDDSLAIGFDADDFAAFHKAVTFKGGLGLDWIHGLKPNGVNKFPGGNAVLSGWESVS